MDTKETQKNIASLQGQANYLKSQIPDYEERIRSEKYNKIIDKLDYFTRYLILIQEDIII